MLMIAIIWYVIGFLGSAIAWLAHVTYINHTAGPCNTKLFTPFYFLMALAGPANFFGALMYAISVIFRI